MAHSSSLLESLLTQLGDGGVEQIGRSVGLSSQDVGQVLAGAIPAIMAGLSRNADSHDGAASLLGALDRNHDGSILDDVIGYLGGADTDDGAAILGHVFGDRRSNVERTVSRSTGIDMAKVSKIMMMVAPLILGAIGRTSSRQGFNANDLSAALRGEQARAHQASPSAVDVLSRVLDSDGDGDQIDDLVKVGTELLGSFLK